MVTGIPIELTNSTSKEAVWRLRRHTRAWNVLAWSLGRGTEIVFWFTCSGYFVRNELPSITMYCIKVIVTRYSARDRRTRPFREWKVESASRQAPHLHRHRDFMLLKIWRINRQSAVLRTNNSPHQKRWLVLLSHPSQHLYSIETHCFPRLLYQF
jgi:hypothetical protein